METHTNNPETWISRYSRNSFEIQECSKDKLVIILVRFCVRCICMWCMGYAASFIVCPVIRFLWNVHVTVLVTIRIIYFFFKSWNCENKLFCLFKWVSVVQNSLKIAVASFWKILSLVMNISSLITLGTIVYSIVMVICGLKNCK